jgi:hypothetical protein
MMLTGRWTPVARSELRVKWCSSGVCTTGLFGRWVEAAQIAVQSGIAQDPQTRDLVLAGVRESLAEMKRIQDEALENAKGFLKRPMVRAQFLNTAIQASRPICMYYQMLLANQDVASEMPRVPPDEVLRLLKQMDEGGE